MRLHDVTALTFPLAPSSPPGREEGGTVGRWSERMLETPHAMVTQVRYVPNEKSGFLIRLLDGVHDGYHPYCFLQSCSHKNER